MFLSKQSTIKRGKVQRGRPNSSNTTTNACLGFFSANKSHEPFTGTTFSRTMFRTGSCRKYAFDFDKIGPCIYLYTWEGLTRCGKLTRTLLFTTMNLFWVECSARSACTYVQSNLARQYPLFYHQFVSTKSYQNANFSNWYIFVNSQELKFYRKKG